MTPPIDLISAAGLLGPDLVLFSVLLLASDHGLRHRRGVPQVLSSGNGMNFISVHVGYYDYMSYWFLLHELLHNDS